MARTVLPRQWSVPAQLSDFARRITSLEKFVLGLAPRRLALVADAVVPITDSRFRTYNSDTIPTVHRKGDVVEFFGALGSDSVMTTATIAGVMQIPAGFRPRGTYSRIVICQGSGTNRWDLVVNESGAGSASGRVDVGRYAPGSSATNTWMPFALTWFTDDPFPAS